MQCWFCGAPAMGFYMLTLEHYGVFPGKVPICSDSACAEKALQCYRTHGSLTVHPCTRCHHKTDKRPGCGQQA